MTGVTIRGWEEGKRKLRARLAGNLLQRMDEVGGYVEQEAKNRAPVWRGILKSDITYVVTARDDMIETILGVRKRAFWARFVERGTKRQAAHPFLRPAVFDNAATILRIIRGKQ